MSNSILKGSMTKQTVALSRLPATDHTVAGSDRGGTIIDADIHCRWHIVALFSDLLPLRTAESRRSSAAERVSVNPH